MNDWRQARETNPPETIDLSRHLDLTSPEPITVRLNDRSFRVPPGTRYVRWGLTQEGLLVESQTADGTWESAEEVPE